MKPKDSDFLSAIRGVKSKLLPYFGSVKIDKHKTSGVDVVTKLDFEIEDFLRKEFYKIDPSVGFVGEENGGDRQSPEHFLVDPIDGTFHFIRGIPYCTTMVALIENGEVVFSAIYDFVNDVMYHARAGAGAFRGNQPIKVSSRSAESAFVFYESNLKKKENLEKYFSLAQRVKLLNTVSAGYEFALVAEGKVEGRVCLDPFGKDYDYAAGSLLVKEAGGVVKNLGSNSFDYRNLNFVASNNLVCGLLDPYLA